MVRPYPYQSWQKVSRGQLRGQRSPAAAFAPDRWDAAAATARRLLAAEPEVHLGHASTPPPCDAAATVARLRQGTGGRPWLLAMPAALVALLADRVLGGEGEGAYAAALARGGHPPDAMSTGAVAYLLSRLCASLGGIGVDGFVRPAELPRLVEVHALVATPISLRIAGTVTQCTLHCPADVEPARRKPRLRPTVAAIEVPLVAVVGHASVMAAELAAIACGDVVTLDDSRCDTGGAGGAQLWVATGGRPLFDVGLGPSGTRIEAIHTREGFAMQEDEPQQQLERGQALSELTGDAAIPLTVDIARLSIPLQRLLELRVGDVLSTGQPVGGRVSVRVGQRTVAHGELVDIEGEVGVRIVELPATKTGRDDRSAP